MKKIFLIILILCFVGWSYLVQTIGSKTDGLIGSCHSMQQSKSVGSFVDEYLVLSIDEGVKSFLEENSIPESLSFNKAKYWVEREYTTYRKLAYFVKFIYSDDLNLVFEDPFSVDSLGIRKFKGMGFSFKMEGSHSHVKSGCSFRQRVGYSAPDSVRLEVYFGKGMKEEYIYVGSVVLKKKEKIS